MKISVITVCYNSENTIEKTIKSVLDQKLKDIEYIIIDGNSKDRTIDIVNKYKSKIFKIISAEDKGIYDAINKGIHVASGDIISILHSDDVYYNNDVLLNVMELFKKENKVDCVIGNTMMVKDNKILRKYSSKSFKNWMMYFGISPPHPSTFLKKKVYDKFGLYKLNYNIAGDFEFFLRIFYINNVNFKQVDSPYVKMQYGGKSTNSLKSNLISSKEIVKSFKENNLYNNYFFILLRIPIKLLQFIFK